MRLSLLGHWLPVLRSQEPAADAVALSIDDGPTSETTPQLLAVMKKFNARATFFVSGIRAVERPDLVRQMVDDGHAVFAHGWEHIRMFAKGGGARVEREGIAAMEKCEALLRRFRPTPFPYLIRLPYGYGHRNPRAHRALRRWQPGSQIADWDLSFDDPTIAPRCANIAEVHRECQRAVAQTLASPRLTSTILICHDHPFDVDGPCKAAVTPILMETVLAGLQARGLRAVPIQARANVSLLSRFVLG